MFTIQCWLKFSRAFSVPAVMYVLGQCHMIVLPVGQISDLPVGNMITLLRYVVLHSNMSFQSGEWVLENNTFGLIHNLDTL